MLRPLQPSFSTIQPPSRQAGMGLLEACAATAAEHDAHSSVEHRRSRGQVFTPPEVARFMASLLVEIPPHLRLLDPGAGPGILTAAVCERVAKLRSPRHVEAHVYENDATVLPLLRKNLSLCKQVLEAAGHRLDMTVHTEDFVLANEPCSQQGSLFRSRQDPFDAVITNPPYYKIAGDSAHAAAFRALVSGQPNIYALFLAVAAELLRPDGSLVAITPRSFCNGLYFRSFRRWFFERMALRHAHLFESRRATFREAGVLQESLITLTTRLGAHASHVRLTTSFGRDDLPSLRSMELPLRQVLDDTCGDMVVRVPSNDIDVQIIETVESWKSRFSDVGLRVSTGPVVGFRAREFLVHDPHKVGTVPLILVHNVRLFRTVWPLLDNGKPSSFRVTSVSEKMLVPTRNYVLLRRFSAKEERRRLTASSLFRSAFPSQRIALENHINYVYHDERELSEDETLGLTALFNSALLDRYFRTLSGNTQVNATELRTLNFPPLGVIADIGRHLRQSKDLDPVASERIVLGALGVNGALGRSLLESAHEQG